MKRIGVINLISTISTMGSLKGRGENFEFEEAIFDNNKTLFAEREKIISIQQEIDMKNAEEKEKWKKYLNGEITPPLKLKKIKKEHLPTELNVAQYSVIREWMM